MSDVQILRDYLMTLPSLSQCHKLSYQQTVSLRQRLSRVDKANSELKTLVQVFSSATTSEPDQRTSKLHFLRDHSCYLSQIERSFKEDWNESSIENPSMLVTAVSSVWLAARKLATVREDLCSIIMLYCPATCFLTPDAIDRVWETDYISYDSEFATFCIAESKVLTSISKDTLVNWNDKWIDILIEKLNDNTFDFRDKHLFDPLLFISVKLHSLAGRLVTKCEKLHTSYAPRALPALKSILEKCPEILQNFDMIENLVAKKPICNILQDSFPSYLPDVNGVDKLKKKAKEYQTKYASLSDDIARYLSICHFSNLKANYDKIFLMTNEDELNLIDFEDSLLTIQDQWDMALDQKLHVYILELEFLSVCDKFQSELAAGKEFLSKYECGKYRDFEIMNEDMKAIQDFSFSSHWFDSRQQEKSKLIEFIKLFRSDDFDEELFNIFDINIATKLVRIIENDFTDFNNLYATVIEYYEQGIKQWKEFLMEVRNFDDNLSSKNYLLNKGFIKFELASKFPDLVKKLRIEAAELQKFREGLDNLQLLGDQLCVSCEGGCQEYIQTKMDTFRDLVEEMKMQAVEVHRELEPLVRPITELEENIKKIEDILLEAQEKIHSNVEDFSKAKPDTFMNYLKSRMQTLKKRTSKISTGRAKLNDFLKIESLDLSLLLFRYEEAEKNLSTILEFLSEKLEEIIQPSLEKTRSQIMFGESNLDSYLPFFQGIAGEDYTQNTIDATKRLHELEDFFNSNYITEFQNTVDTLTECSKELNEDELKVEIGNLEESLNKLEISIRSTKILIHFVITYCELHEVLLLRESFIQVSSKPSYMADKIGFVSAQFEELFGDDFKICRTYYKQLRSRYNEYLSDDNQPSVLPLSLEIVSRLESKMRDRLEALENSVDDFGTAFKEIENSITQFRKESQNIIAFADKLENAFTNKENLTIRDSSVLENQCEIWEHLLAEGQSILTQYDSTFETVYKIYDNLSPSPKVTFVENKFPRAKEHLTQLNACLNLFQKYQTDLKLNEDRLSTLANNFSHFYTEMRFPSITTNGNVTDKNDQRCEEFRNELHVITNSVRSLRIGLPELLAGSHPVVEYSIIEETRIKQLEEQLPEWENKIDGLSQECTRNSLFVTESISHLGYEQQINEGSNNGHFSYEIISQEPEYDSGAYNLSLESDENLNEETRKIQEKLTKWKRWLKRKEKAPVMQSDISIKLTEAQIQKREIDITKHEFEKKKADFLTIFSSKEASFSTKLVRFYKEIERLFNNFEILMSKRCGEVSNKVCSLFELHLLIQLCEQQLLNVENVSKLAMNKENTLEEQFNMITDLRNKLKDCEKDYIDKIREQFADLTRNSFSISLSLTSSPEPSSESHSETDTEEKQSSLFTNSQTSLLLPAVPCREQIQTIEAKFKALSQSITEHLHSLTERQENANQFSIRIQEFNQKIVILSAPGKSSTHTFRKNFKV